MNDNVTLGQNSFRADIQAVKISTIQKLEKVSADESAVIEPESENESDGSMIERDNDSNNTDIIRNADNDDLCSSASSQLIDNKIENTILSYLMDYTEDLIKVRKVLL